MFTVLSDSNTSAALINRLSQASSSGLLASAVSAAFTQAGLAPPTSISHVPTSAFSVVSMTGDPSAPLVVAPQGGGGQGAAIGAGVGGGAAVVVLLLLLMRHRRVPTDKEPPSTALAAAPVAAADTEAGLARAPPARAWRLSFVALLMRSRGAEAQMMASPASSPGAYPILAPPSTPTDSHATSVVLDWAAVLRSLARGSPSGDWAFEDPSPLNTTSRVGAFQFPPLPNYESARTHALVTLAMREALSPLTRPGEPGALLGPGWGGVGAGVLLDAQAFPGAAASFAAHYVLCALWPQLKQAMFSDAALGFDGILARHLSAPGYGLAGAWQASGAVAAAQRVGVAAGRIAIQLASGDGWDVWHGKLDEGSAYRPTGCATLSLCVPANDTGVRQADSSDWGAQPQAGSSVPMVLGAVADWLPPAAPASSAELRWVAAVGEANSSARSLDQTQSAWFWRLGNNTGGVVGLLTALCVQQLDQAADGSSSGSAADLWVAADALARLSAALWDTSVVVARAKATFASPRPETALRLSGQPWWSPELANPPVPDFPSWHSAACGAGAAVLASLFGDAAALSLETEDLRDWRGGAGGLDFSQPSPASLAAAAQSGAFSVLRGIGLYAVPWRRLMLPPRTFASFSSMADDCAQSRVFGGVSLNSSTVAGLSLGRTVGAFVAASFPANLTLRGTRAATLVHALYGAQAYSGRSSVAPLVLE